MDATQGTSVELLDKLDMWLHSCDICVKVATGPVATTCGHFFCRSCLNEAFHGPEQARPCPVCTADVREVTAQSFPINRIGTPAETTPQAADSETPIPNAGYRGPAARIPTAAYSSLISIARMDVVQDYLEEANEDIHNVQLTLGRQVSDLRGERILELEQLVENLVHMNLAVVQELEDCEHDRRRMTRRIVELENPTVSGGRAFARRQRRVGRGITPTPIAAGNDEAAPESVEGRLFTTNN